MSPAPPPRRVLNAPLRVSLYYALFGFAWIWLGDVRLLNTGLITTHAWLVSVAKGLLFVAGSAALLYVLVRREVAAQRRADRASREVDELATATRLAGGVAHEFNNILTAIVGHAELLTESLGRTDHRREHAEAIHHAAARAADLTHQLLVFSGSNITTPVVLDLSEVIRNLSASLRRSAGDRIAVEFRLATDVWPIRSDVSQLQQLLLSFASHARDALPDGGTLRLQTANVPRESGQPAGAPPGDYILLRVSDDGAGMDEPALQHVFDPFVSSRPDGSGLGLATVQRTVRQAGAHIRVHSSPGAGTTFEIHWPRAVEARAPELPQHPGGPARTTILVVEDDDAVRQLTTRILRRRGHEVLPAGSGEEALQLLERHPDIQLVITDILMPGMSGLQLGATMRRLHPDLPILFTSGFAAGSLRDASELEPGTLFLEKPFSPEELLARADQLLLGSAD